MVEFASRWPDMRAWGIARLEQADTITALLDGGRVSAERDEDLPRQIVVSVVPAQMVTPISRAFLVTLQCWLDGDKQKAQQLCSEGIYTLVSTPHRGQIVTCDENAGPIERRDRAGTYYSEGTALIVAKRLSSS